MSEKISITHNSRCEFYLKSGGYTTRLTRNEAYDLAIELLELTERRKMVAVPVEKER